MRNRGREKKLDWSLYHYVRPDWLCVISVREFYFFKLNTKHLAVFCGFVPTGPTMRQISYSRSDEGCSSDNIGNLLSDSTFTLL